MKEFNFRFETVLNVREQEERKKQAELAEAEGELQTIQEEIQQIDRQYDEAKNKMRKLQSGSLSVDYIRIIKNRMNALMQEMGDRVGDYKESLQAVRDKRRELIEASRKKRAMEILKEQEWEQYLEEYYKEEQEFLDDITQSREFGLRKKEEI